MPNVYPLAFVSIFVYILAMALETVFVLLIEFRNKVDCIGWPPVLLF